MCVLASEALGKIAESAYLFKCKCGVSHEFCVPIWEINFVVLCPFVFLFLVQICLMLLHCAFCLNVFLGRAQINCLDKYKG